MLCVAPTRLPCLLMAPCPFRALLRLCRFAAVLVSGVAISAPLCAQQINCHYHYGGETKSLRVAATASPYTVPAIQIGSFFRLRAVLEDAPAALKIYTYADRDDGPVIIHQASYLLPARNARQYGFTGLQSVYEPVRDGELQYWCTQSASRR